MSAALIATARASSLIVRQNNDLFADSNIIAGLFGRPHKNVMRDVDRLVADGAIDRLRVEPIFYVDSYGREQPAYRLTERDSLILMPFIGGRKSAQGQARLVDDFMRMRAELRRIASRKADPVLLDARREKCAMARHMTDCLVEQRTAIGKDTKPHHYRNEHELCNWALTGCFDSINDDDISVEQLRRLRSIRSHNAILLVRGLPYRERKDALRNKFPLLHRAESLELTGVAA